MDDYKTKYEKRYQLSQERNKNIKKAITILLILLIIVGIGNHMWNKHMQEVKADQRRIQSMNQMLLYEVNTSLDHLNNIIIKLIYDMEIENYDYVHVTEASNAISDLSWVRYDYDLYRMDNHETRNFLSQVSATVRDAMHKGVLTDREKEGLAELMKFNINVTSVLNDINYKFYDHDKREELEYLYYYKGEMLYLLNNTVASYMVGVDTYFIDVDYSQNDVKEEQLTLEEASEIASYISSEVLDLGEVYLDKKQFSNTRDGQQVLHSAHFKNDEFGESEFVDIDLDGYYYYTKEHKDTKAIVSHEELLEESQLIMSRIDQPMLKLVTDNEEDFNNGEGDRTRHSFVYSIVDGDYIDEWTRVSFEYSGDGVLTDFAVSDVSLITSEYHRDIGKLSREEALKVLPKRVWSSIIEINEEKREKQSYIITYEDYGHEFKAAIDVNTGEILAISANEWISY